MNNQDCINLENNQGGSDALTIILTLFLLMIVIIGAECNKN